MAGDRAACPLPQAHKLRVEMFSSKLRLKIIIISHLILYVFDFSVCLFIYLLDVVCGSVCQSAFAVTQPHSLSGVQQ